MKGSLTWLDMVTWAVVRVDALRIAWICPYSVGTETARPQVEHRMRFRSSA
jgi:hypothetical protein